jgi:hypothetical protein
MLQNIETSTVPKITLEAEMLEEAKPEHTSAEQRDTNISVLDAMR